MEKIIVLGGEVWVARSQYSVDYTVDVMTHPHFNQLSFEKRVMLLHKDVRRNGTKLTWGGCSTWTPEQFLDTILHKNDVADALMNCMTENNYISSQFGITDFETVKKRLSKHRAITIAKTLMKLASEGIVLHESAKPDNH